MHWYNTHEIINVIDCYDAIFFKDKAYSVCYELARCGPVPSSEWDRSVKISNPLPMNALVNHI
jgi:hypothetical protein